MDLGDFAHWEEGMSGVGEGELADYGIGNLSWWGRRSIVGGCARATAAGFALAVFYGGRVLLEIKGDLLFGERLESEGSVVLT